MSGIDIFDDYPGPDPVQQSAGNTSLPVPGQSPAESKAEALVAAEQQRTERARVDAIQRQLRLETTARSRGYGIRSLIGALGQGRSSVLGAG